MLCKTTHLKPERKMLAHQKRTCIQASTTLNWKLIQASPPLLSVHTSSPSHAVFLSAIAQQGVPLLQSWHIQDERLSLILSGPIQ